MLTNIIDSYKTFTKQLYLIVSYVSKLETNPESSSSNELSKFFFVENFYISIVTLLSKRVKKWVTVPILGVDVDFGYILI